MYILSVNSIFIRLLLSIHFLLGLVVSVDNPIDFVNLLAGTFTDGQQFSTGNTLPLVGRPWGFNHWSPQTREEGRAGSWWFNGIVLFVYSYYHIMNVNTYTIYTSCIPLHIKN